MRLFLPMLTAALLLGCPKPTQAPAAPLAAAGTPPETSPMAPFPYTAEQIAAAWRPPLSVTWRIRLGETENYFRWSVLEADEDGALMGYYTCDERGAAFGEPELGQSSWTELQSHASFPASHTTVEEIVYEAPFGALPALLYTIADPPDAPGTTKRFWFGLETPGAPLRHTIEADGQVVMEMLMLSREGAP